MDKTNSADRENDGISPFSLFACFFFFFIPPNTLAGALFMYRKEGAM